MKKIPAFALAVALLCLAYAVAFPPVLTLDDVLADPRATPADIEPFIWDRLQPDGTISRRIDSVPVWRTFKIN